MKILRTFDYDLPPFRSDIAGAEVFVTCFDGRPTYLVFREVVEVNPEAVVFVDVER